MQYRLGYVKGETELSFYCLYNLQKYKEKDKHKQKYKKQSESSPSLVPSLTVTTEKVSQCVFSLPLLLLMSKLHDVVIPLYIQELYNVRNSIIIKRSWYFFL